MLYFLIILAILVVLYFVCNAVHTKWKKAEKDLSNLLHPDPEHPNTALFEMRRVDGTLQIIFVPKPVVEKGSPPRDPLERYRRRYGLCGQFSRMTRKSRRERAKRALEDAIRKQDTERLQMLHAIGIR